MLTSGSRTTCKLTPVLFKKKEKNDLNQNETFEWEKKLIYLAIELTMNYNNYLID